MGLTGCNYWGIFGHSHPVSYSRAEVVALVIVVVAKLVVGVVGIRIDS